MHYREVVNKIVEKRFLRVLVTGPQRSGTTIVGRIIAQELGFRFVDECDIKINDFDAVFKLYQESNFVLQAPGLAAYCHMMPEAVIFVRRPVEEIIRSEERMNEYMKWTSEFELAKYFRTEGIISQIKYDIWDQWQKHKDNMFELDYHSIKDHPLYVPDKDRTKFLPKQTEVNAVNATPL